MPELIKKLQGLVGNLLRGLKREDIHLLKDMDILFLAHGFKYFRPYGDTNLTNMCLFEQVHVGTGLTNATPNAERDFVIQDCLVVWKFEKILLAGHLQLLLERVCVDADTHGCQFVAPLGNRVPDENVTVETMHGLPIF